MITKGGILRQDFSLYDGVNKTASRRDSTGGTIQGFRIGGQVDVLGLYGSLSRRSILDAITHVGTNDATLLFTPGLWDIDDNLTISLPCYINAGAVFYVATGKTLTFSGPVVRESGTWTSGPGTVSYTPSNNVIAHQDDLASTDSGKGAELVAYPLSAGEIAESTTIVNAYYPTGDVRRYGADPTGTDDSASAIQTAYDLARDYSVPYRIPEGTYRIDSMLDFDADTGPSGQVIGIFEDAIIKKNFNGIGITFSGGSYFNEIHGSLKVTKMTNLGTGTGATNSAEDHGVVFDGNRVRQFGKMWVTAHQGHGVKFIASNNANRCIFSCLLSDTNNRCGFDFSGTEDNNAVWDVNFYARTNYTGGMIFADTYVARGWRGYLYNEAGAGNGSADGIYFGGMTYGDIAVYSEEQSTSGVEMNIPAATTYVNIEGLRIGTITHSSDTVLVKRGGEIYRSGTGTIAIGSTRLPNFSDNVARVAEYSYYGSSSALLGKIIVYGNGQMEILSSDRGGDTVSVLLAPESEGFKFYANTTEVARITKAGALAIKDGITAPSQLIGFMQLFVDTSDGDLKAIFADGTTKLISADT